jgi:hypothetical protein
MSQRLPVDRQRIVEFLRRLGERYRGQGRVWLVGGTTVVFEGYRSQTLDVDLTYETDPADEARFLQTVRELKDALSINVEQVSPADFIPLPSGWRDRSQFVGRFGGVEVFHFDLYSTTLSKIERGSEQDFADALALLRAGQIEWARLESYYDEILPQFGARSLKQDPEEFQEKFNALRQMWRSQNQGEP